MRKNFSNTVIGRSKTPQPLPDWPERYRRLAAQSRLELLRRFYAHGIVAGDTPLNAVPFVAMDFETTGMHPQIHGIVSIGVVPFSLQRIRCAEARHWLVKPRRPLIDRSVLFHHITHSELECAPDLSDILPDLLAVLAGRVVVVHYRGIERPFLDRSLRTRFDEGISFPVVDTMALEARFHRTRLQRMLRHLIGRRQASIRLASTRTRYGLPQYGAHHALTDALATAELFQAQVAHRFSPDTPIRALWC